MVDYISIETEAGSFDAMAAGPEGGRPVMLLHGFPEAALEWSHQLAGLAAVGYRVVAPDQRGYSPGVRPESPSDYRIETLVADVIAMADRLGWQRFDLVGHDWGGAVAWWAADIHPHRVRSLAAVSTPHPGALAEALRTDEDQARRSQYMRDWRATPATENAFLADGARALRRIFEGGVPREHVDEYVQRLSEPGALTAALNWYRAGGPEGRIGRITVPTLYVWSTEDVALGSVAALATADWVEAPYRFEMLEDVSHWVPEEAAEQLTVHLVAHLEGT
ncbi:alpha/beta hydrolase [Tsukamurella sp. 8F]|uniref:alpha/beta fold hydrolase n=1 Tax=unclassified Tsukamurella TaxID=2633480 RepID=UPI0023B8D5E6|nr:MULTISPECIES: alpha/beta hydrolase [unclassified Tsukamurella]MDF0529246.1 alpha/beta hydrolase [Tsukamurella sp. 8J]MDF0585431.1 alpha/beta hydrolase [Tsukamurella sp. 8F]